MKFSIALAVFFLASGATSGADELASPRVAKQILEIPGSTNRAWVYWPIDKESEKLVTVLISPAGSRLFHGMSLSPEDEAEFLPYAEAGMAVVAFETSGSLGEDDSDFARNAAIDKFLAAKGGVLDAAQALKTAAARFPCVDPARVYCAGHSSAGTLALQLAQASGSFKGCVAYAPTPDLGSVTSFLTIIAPEKLEAFSDFASDWSPRRHVDELKCPVMIFHAKDDSVVHSSDIRRYVDALADARKPHTFIQAESGDHYESMIRDGIPRGIAWITSVEAGEGPAPPAAESRLFTGKSLSIPLAPGMKPSESRLHERDIYTLHWLRSDLRRVDVQLNPIDSSITKTEDDLAWSDIAPLATIVHEKFNEEIRKESYTRPGAETEASPPTMAPLQEGIFRGYWIKRRESDGEAGERWVHARFVLWDRKRAWFAIVDGTESDLAKALDLFQSIRFVEGVAP